jgi:hypothetical protein
MSADSEVLRITVDVTYDANQHVVLDGYRTRYMPTTQLSARPQPPSAVSPWSRRSLRSS